MVSCMCINELRNKGATQEALRSRGAGFSLHSIGLARAELDVLFIILFFMGV
jgi:hypothetical protein